MKVKHYISINKKYHNENSVLVSNELLDYWEGRVGVEALKIALRDPNARPQL